MSKQIDEGYIKFNCTWLKDLPLPEKKLIELNKWRQKLYKLGLIGAYANGIGFGNISIRASKNSFIITGSATGHLPELTPNHYVLVTAYNLTKNSLTCQGPIKASSESLSHAVIYECLPETNCVIHIHNLKLWQELFNKAPTTDKKITYGTPEMAEEIKKLFKETDINKKKLLVMGGHEEGIISFGKDLQEAGHILLKNFRHK